jgi:hypothetical protein
MIVEPNQHRHIGYVDAVRDRTVFGWAYDTLENDRIPILRIQINGVDAGLTLANRYRPDLSAVGITQPRGYEWAIPDEIGHIGSVRVISVDSRTELTQSSNSLICPRSNRLLPKEWKSAERYRLPSFFILGAAKCGTTSVHGYLGQHPDICVSDPKEPFYFEAEFDRGGTYYFNRYFAHWSREKIVGEARHRNLYMSYTSGRIFRFNPSARLIICLRNPTERAVSHWWHWYSRGQEHLPLRNAIDADSERIRAGQFYDKPENQRIYSATLEPDGKGYLRTYVDSGYYYEQIMRYLTLFPREQLRIILFEDIVYSPETIARELLEFVGADPSYASNINYRPLNQSSPEMIDYADSESLVWLIEHYRPHNQMLSALIGRPLDHWNEPFQISQTQS